MRMHLQLFVLCVAAALAACSVKPVTFTPGDGPVAEDCTAVGDEDGNGLADCNDPACAAAPSCQPACGNGRVDPGEQCDDGNTTNGDACEASCTLPACGNGIVDVGEQCDDGNTINGPGLRCNAMCRLNVCGDGDKLIGVEECDDGNTTDGDACETSCTLPKCGNGIKDVGEQCDDGNTINGDACETSCTLPVCGNGIRDPGEQCDTGADSATCDSDCTPPVCGDRHVNLLAGEQCDDGNAINGDGCSSTCKLERCGNGIVDSGEQCDDGNTTNGDACENNCTLPRCGNGIKDVGEQCDDGNTLNGDACENNCTLPVCGNGIKDVGEQCDDGNTLNGDACENNCTLPRCGNGIKDTGEQCDDGNTTNGDTCENNCTTPRCGNGIVDSGEQCDTAGDSATCDSDCTVSVCGDGYVNVLAGEQCDDGNMINGDGCDSCRIAACTLNLVPIMTSPTSPSGAVSRSGAIDAADEAWQAFDGSTSTMWISGTFETPAWIAYQWVDGPHKVTSYAISFVNGSSLTTRAPRDWTFEGWNGSSWNVIDTQSAQTGWLGVERRVYTVAAPGSYGMYRLNISDDNDSRTGVVVISMGSLEFIGCPP